MATVGPSGGKARRRSLEGVLAIVALLLIGLLGIWSTDRITLQGERTIFAVRCEDGAWDGERCTGRLAAGERYAFRASATRHEVVHWVRGSHAPSGKYGDCTVNDRDNWSCTIRTDERPAVTRAMVNGMLTDACPEAAGRIYWVPKWKWWALDLGIGRFDSAAGSVPDCTAH